MDGESIEFRILGPLDALVGGRPVGLGRGKGRTVLALLLLHANEVVSADRLIEELWREHPPATAANTLQVHVGRLRRVLGAGVLETKAPGYVVRVEPEQLDARRFERLAERGREALAHGEAGLAAELLGAALALWRGPALADVELGPGARSEVLRIDDARVAALEDRIEADLALGRHAELVGELEALIQEHPLREGLRGQLMLALYRAGRQADALEAYRRARSMLVEELGIEPGPALQRLERAILAQDASLEGPARAARERRAPALPAAPTPLVGRDRELAELIELARRDEIRLVTLTGPGGIGKTRLALAAAQALAEEFEAVAFVPLETISDPALVKPTIAARTGVDLEDLRGQRSLLVLDNFEQLLAAAPLLAELLAEIPDLTLLVTSRSVLRLSGEHEVLVAPLSPDAAAALFAQRAAGVGRPPREDEADTVAELCSRLDGLPLAIELAAARSKLVEPETMLARLAHRFEVLGTAPRDAPARQHTLRATLDWSHGLLDPAEQRLFSRLAVFVGGCTLDAAEAVCEATLEGLESLVDKSLVQQARGRFSMLETIREYAASALAESGEEGDLRSRHAQHFVGLAVEVEPMLSAGGQSDALARLDLEHDNLRAALAFALEAGDADAALHTCAGIRVFWLHRGYLAEGRRWTEAALALDGGDDETRMKALTGAGIMAGDQGDFVAARGFFEETLALARARGSRERVASALSNLGTLAHFDGRYDEARRLREESLELWRELDDGRGASIALENLGLLALAERDPTRALTLLEESERLARAAGDLREIAATLESRARALMEKQELGDAAAALRESLEIAHGLGEQHVIAEALEGFAALAVAEGDPATAALLLGGAAGLREAIGARLQPDRAAWLDELFDQTRAALDDKTFAIEFERGPELSRDAVVEIALGSVAAG